MSAAPYEKTFQQGGETCFFAEAPALAHIGQRFDELSERSFHYDAPAEEHEQWRQLIARLEQLVAETAQNFTSPWTDIEAMLQKEFPSAFPQARSRVAGPVHEYFQIGQMPLSEYVEFLLSGAEQAWSLNGGGEQGLDIDAVTARMNRLAKRLQASSYETERDRQMRQEDPQRYEFLVKSMELLNRSMQDLDDPQAYDNMVVEQMNLFRQSPMFEEAQRAQNEMRQQMERLRETHPELYQQQVEAFEQMERFNRDPAAALQEMRAAMPLPGEDMASDEDSEPAPHAPPGQLLFRCGKRKKVAPEQIQLFHDFMQSQERLRPQIEAALREMHRWMHSPPPHAWPGDRLLFPDTPDATDTPLQCFRIRHVNLDAKAGGDIFLSLDSLFGHFDEHGCGILIRNGAVERYGTWDDLNDEGDWENMVD